MRCACSGFMITSISRESGKLQKSRHVLATRRCCYASDTPEGMILPTPENHLHVYSIFSGKDSKLRESFTMHLRALCKLKKTVVLQVLGLFFKLTLSQLVSQLEPVCCSKCSNKPSVINFNTFCSHVHTTLMTLIVNTNRYGLQSYKVHLNTT